MTLESQHREWLQKNPDKSLTFEEWKSTILQDYIQGALASIESEKDPDSPYCPVCTGCGEVR